MVEPKGAATVREFAAVQIACVGTLERVHLNQIAAVPEQGRLEVEVG